MPSPDPLRSIVPLDLFPTGTLKGVTVQKSYSADKPGSFGAGLVELDTKGVPESDFLELGLSTGYNSQSTGKTGLTYDGGDEFLGTAGSTLEMPPSVAEATDGGNSKLELGSDEAEAEYARAFPNNYQVSETTMGPDTGLSVSGGKTFDTDWGEYGVMGSFSWDRKSRSVEELERAYEYSGTLGGLKTQQEYDTTRTDLDIQTGGLLVLSGKWGGHELRSNSFFIRDTTKRVEVSEGFNRNSDDRYERNYLLDWNQREMMLQQFAGSHDLGWAQLDWRTLSAEGERSNPDRRSYKYIRFADGHYEMGFNGGLRRYNAVTDSVTSSGIDLERQWLDSNALRLKSRLGWATMSQDRASSSATFRFKPEGSANTALSNPEDILDPDNVANGTVSFRDFPQGAGDYDGTKDVDATYLLLDTTFPEMARLVVGARQEAAAYSVTTYTNTPSGRESSTGGFDRSKLLPGASATWFMNDTMQLRAGYSETVSRPLLIELSDTVYYDPDTGEPNSGNPDLKPAEIESFDLRWEWYPADDQAITLGVFRKDYTNPIERSYILRSESIETSRVNAPGAEVTGQEAAVRYGLESLAGEGWTQWLGSAYVSANVTLLESTVSLPEDTKATNPDRALQGQAEHIYNLQLGYEGENQDWTVLYNEVGRRLDQAGIINRPDIYQESVAYLNLVWRYRFAENWELKFEGENLLDPDVEFVQGGKIERSYSEGRDFSLGVKYTF